MSQTGTLFFLFWLRDAENVIALDLARETTLKIKAFKQGCAMCKVKRRSGEDMATEKE